MAPDIRRCGSGGCVIPPAGWFTSATSSTPCAPTALPRRLAASADADVHPGARRHGVRSRHRHGLHGDDRQVGVTGERDSRGAVVSTRAGQLTRYHWITRRVSPGPLVTSKSCRPGGWLRDVPDAYGVPARARRGSPGRCEFGAVHLPLSRCSRCTHYLAQHRTDCRGYSQCLPSARRSVVLHDAFVESSRRRAPAAPPPLSASRSP